MILLRNIEQRWSYLSEFEIIVSSVRLLLRKDTCGGGPIVPPCECPCPPDVGGRPSPTIPTIRERLVEDNGLVSLFISQAILRFLVNHFFTAFLLFILIWGDIIWAKIFLRQNMIQRSWRTIFLPLPSKWWTANCFSYDVIQWQKIS